MGGLRSDASSMAIVIAGTDEYVFRAGGSLPGNSSKDVCTMGMSKLAAAVAQASTSGVAIDFTGIPPWARRITVMLRGVSTNGSSPPQLQLGTSSGFETTGYDSSAVGGPTANSLFGITSTTGLLVTAFIAAANLLSGVLTLSRLDGNIWMISGTCGPSGTPSIYMSAGSKSLAGVLDRIRLTTVNGTDAFDAGSVNIMWE